MNVCLCRLRQAKLLDALTEAFETALATELEKLKPCHLAVMTALVGGCVPADLLASAKTLKAQYDEASVATQSVVLRCLQSCDCFNLSV